MKKLTASEIHTISRAFGITVPEMVETSKRVEDGRCYCDALTDEACMCDRKR